MAARTPDLRSEQGMALLITIMTVALLVAVTLQYHKTTWDKYLASRNYMSGTQLTAIAESGINIAMAVLQEDDREADSLHDGWAMLEKEPFRELFSTGTLKIKIEDLSGRFPINNIAARAGSGGQGGVNAVTAGKNREILTKLLSSGAFPKVEDETMAKQIVDAVTDWIDENDEESDFGAENGYYQSLAKPYSCKNKPLEYIEELLLVRGMTPALLFGSGENPGLADFLTVHAAQDGNINLNTAPLLLIQCLMDPPVDDQMIQDLGEYRKAKEKEEELKTPSWYRNVAGWSDITLQNITTKSTFFQVTSTGTLETLSRRIVASVERADPDEVNLLGRRME